MPEDAALGKEYKVLVAAVIVERLGHAAKTKPT